MQNRQTFHASQKFEKKLWSFLSLRHAGKHLITNFDDFAYQDGFLSVHLILTAPLLNPQKKKFLIPPPSSLMAVGTLLSGKKNP